MLPCLRALSLGLRMCGARQIRGCYGDTDQCDGTLRTLQIWQGRTLIGLVLPDNLKKTSFPKRKSPSTVILFYQLTSLSDHTINHLFKKPKGLSIAPLSLMWPQLPIWVFSPQIASFTGHRL